MTDEVTIGGDHWSAPVQLGAFSLDDLSDDDRSILEPQIPNKGIADAYVSRTVYGTWDGDLFGTYLDNRRNILLEGPTGSAKTTSLRAFAAQWGLPFVQVPVSGSIDLNTLFDSWGSNEAGQLHRQDTSLHAAWRCGGVVVFDELNMALASTLARLHELLDSRRQITLTKRRGEVVRPAKCLLVAATSNPVKTYRGTEELSQAVANRFAHRCPWPYLRAVEDVLVDIPSIVDLAWRIRRSDDTRADLGTNRLVEYREAIETLGGEYAHAMFVDNFPASERLTVESYVTLVSDQIEDEVAQWLAQGVDTQDA